MGTDHRRGERCSTNDVGRVVFLCDEGIEPVEWTITGRGGGARATAVYENTPAYREALDRYFDTDNCCRVYRERCHKLLRQMQDASDAGDAQHIDLQPLRQPKGD